MLETQISPIFGLMLIGLVEIIAIISIIGVFATVFFLYVSTTRKTKTESANISLKLLEMGRNDKYQQTFKKIRDDEKLEKQEIKELLRYYEYVAEFLKDKVLSYDHVLHIHGRNLKLMYNKKEIRKIFDEARTKSSYNYTNLHDLFLRINSDL